VHAKIVKKFFSSQTGWHCGDLSLQKAKILDKTLQKATHATSLSDWTALTGPSVILKECFT